LIAVIFQGPRGAHVLWAEHAAIALGRWRSHSGSLVCIDISANYKVRKSAVHTGG
jgi:hypothetical protein